MLVRHKKTGKIYEAICEAGDATNGREGVRMVVYSDVGAPYPQWVREATEFGTKFSEVDPDADGCSGGQCEVKRGKLLYCAKHWNVLPEDVRSAHSTGDNPHEQ